MKNLKEMSLDEQVLYGAGANYIWTDTSNGLVYAMEAAINAGVFIYNCITGESDSRL